MELDARKYGGELEKFIVKQRELDQRASEAAKDLEAAREGLKAARDADVGADVKSILAGEDGADERSEPAAVEALRLAERNEVVCSRARLANLDKLVAEAGNAKYAEKITKDEEKLVKCALAAVNTLEKILDDVATTRSARNWLEKPADDHRLLQPIRFAGIWCGSERTRQPNGDAARSNELTGVIREALLGNDRETRLAHETYGLPVGAKLSGPWGTVEPLPSATRAQAALMDELTESWKAKPPKAKTEA